MPSLSSDWSSFHLFSAWYSFHPFPESALKLFQLFPRNTEMEASDLVGSWCAFLKVPLSLENSAKLGAQKRFFSRFSCLKQQLGHLIHYDFLLSSCFCGITVIVSSYIFFDAPFFRQNGESLSSGRISGFHPLKTRKHRWDRRRCSLGRWGRVFGAARQHLGAANDRPSIRPYEALTDLTGGVSFGGA